VEYLLIDGYNVINNWRDIFNLKNEPLEDCRERLLNLLSNFQGYKGVNVIVVFDAHLVKESRQIEEKFDNITVVYTKEKESADVYIERFVYNAHEDDIVRVVTSDYLEQRMVLTGGGIRVTPKELKLEMQIEKRETNEKIKHIGMRRNTIMSNLDQELLEILEKMRRQ